SENGAEHSLWACTDQHELANFHAALADLSVYVADGHHRYTTALRFRDALVESGERLDRDSAPNFVMAHLVQCEDEGLPVRGINRLIRLGATTAEQLRAAISPWWDLTEGDGSLDQLSQQLEAEPHQRGAF